MVSKTLGTRKSCRLEERDEEPSPEVSEEMGEGWFCKRRKLWVWRWDKAEISTEYGPINRSGLRVFFKKSTARGKQGVLKTLLSLCAVQGEWKKTTSGWRVFWGTWCHQVSIKGPEVPFWRKWQSIREPCRQSSCSQRTEEAEVPVGQHWEEGIQEQSRHSGRGLGMGTRQRCAPGGSEASQRNKWSKWLQSRLETQWEETGTEETKFESKRNVAFKPLQHASPMLDQGRWPALPRHSGSQTYILSSKLEDRLLAKSLKLRHRWLKWKKALDQLA